MISKELFVECIENLRLQLNDDVKNANLIKEAFNAQDFALYDNTKLIRTIFKLLWQYFPQESNGFCEIEHYCFVLDFGKLSREDLYEEPEEMYDRLIKDK